MYTEQIVLGLNPIYILINLFNFFTFSLNCIVNRIINNKHNLRY